jgi:RNA polymerase sigma-70 factor (ECF subfamily)
MASVQYNFTNEVLGFRDSLKYFALSLTNNEEESDDLLQETMLKAFTYKDRFAENTNLKAWLYTIMKNIFINNYRRNIKTRTIIDGTKDAYFINIPQVTRESDPESTLSYGEIQGVVDSLEDEYKVPLSMYFEGFKYKEIADDLNLPIGTVKSRIFLARKQLMSMLSEYSY